jgi:hypothetical protein
MKRTVLAALVLTMVGCAMSQVAARASDGHRYHHQRLGPVNAQCSSFHFHVIEVRHYAIVRSSLRPAVACGGWWQPNPSDTQAAGQANSYNY